MDWIHIERDIQGYTETEKNALALLNEGKNYFHIAYKLHVSFERARDIVFSIRKKESLIMGKLTDQQRAEIYQKWKDGQAPKALAEEYSVSDQSIYNLVNKMNAQKPAPVELEDVENGIPNTPLMPQRKPAQINQEFEAKVKEMIENTEKNAANAEKKSAIAKIQECVKRACDQRIKDLDEEISIRSARIEDLKYEVEQFAEELRQIRAWRDSQL